MQWKTCFVYDIWLKNVIHSQLSYLQIWIVMVFLKNNNTFNNGFCFNGYSWDLRTTQMIFKQRFHWNEKFISIFNTFNKSDRNVFQSVSRYLLITIWGERVISNIKVNNRKLIKLMKQILENEIPFPFHSLFNRKESKQLNDNFLSTSSTKKLSQMWGQDK